MSTIERDNRGSQPQTRMVNMRIPVKQLSFLDRVAQMEGKTRTDFILDAANSYATNAFLDRTFFNLTEEQWEAFNDVLDAPAKDNPQLAKIMIQKAPWE